jgi:hypothetical protein
MKLTNKQDTSFTARRCSLLQRVIVGIVIISLPYASTVRAQSVTMRKQLLTNGGKLYFVGDSLTSGKQSFVELMQTILSSSFPDAKITLVKNGLSGVKMAQLQASAEADLRGQHSDAVAVFVEDAGLTDSPSSVFEESLRALIISAQPRRVFVLNEGRHPKWISTATDVKQRQHEEQIYNYWRNELNPKLAQVARSTGSQLVDYENALRRFLTRNPQANILHPDGLHHAMGGKLLMALVCLRSLGFKRLELDLAGINLDAELKQSILQSVYASR